MQMVEGKLVPAYGHGWFTCPTMWDKLTILARKTQLSFAYEATSVRTVSLW